MPDNAYRKAMDKVRVSEDFEARTLEKIGREAETRGNRKIIPMKRRPFRVAGIAAGLAAALAIALTLPQLLPVRESAPVQEPARQTAESTMNAHAGTNAPAPQAKTASRADRGLTLDAALAPEAETDSFSVAQAPMVGVAPVPAAQAGFNTNEFSYNPESGFKSTLTSPLSTFAADVDTASYAIVRRMLLSGQRPTADAVRIEEMINYFRYDYPEPADGEPFSVTTEVAPCPWNPDAKLLLVGLQAKAPDDAQRLPSNLVFLIDVSGSMDSIDKLGLVQKAFLMLTEQMKPGDRVSIVTYAGYDSVVLTGATSEDKARIQSAIENLTAGGGTAGSEGIKTAYRIAREQFIDGGNNRVILATDGDLNIGVTSEGELTRLIEEEKQGGVFLSVMGFGDGNYKDNKLEALADHGDGNYAYIDSELEARKVLVEEMGANFFTVCKDVKLQIEFNPAKVSKYRQIGYENRQMASEDFADDTKDGGEIGAGHRVTVLYEIIEAGGGEADSGLKYQTNETTGSDEYATVSVRAKAPDGDTSKLYTYPVGADSAKKQMSDNLNFASAVAQAGMLLRGSAYSGSASFANVAKQLESIPNIQSDPYKDEFAYLIRRIARGEIQ